ncbi:hypothetical protein K438DRAFT_1761571 [Mycena galopus ATCC 62051]|nr:hypothetical protein K438DRAFT_1761571 [Mycena galopus ATCC 62051]
MAKNAVQQTEKDAYLEAVEKEKYSIVSAIRLEFVEAAYHLKEFALVGAVVVSVLLAMLLCLRNRVLERRQLNEIGSMQASEDPEHRPRLYDAYLEGYGELWHDMMVGDALNITCDVPDMKQPVSLHQFWSETRNVAQPTSIDTAASRISTVALIVSMPSLHPVKRDIGPSDSSSNEHPVDDALLPYVEFGIIDVEVLKQNTDW